MFKTAAIHNPSPNLPAKLAAAESALAAAQSVRQSASLEVELDANPTTRRALETATAELRGARERLEAVQAAIAEHTKRRAKDDEIASAADRARRWGIVESQGAIRERAAKELVGAMARLVEPWERLRDATQAMAGASVVRDVDGALLRSDALTAAFRVALYRAGFTWASPYKLGTDGLPDLVTDVMAANAHALNQRAA